MRNTFATLSRVRGEAIWAGIVRRQAQYFSRCAQHFYRKHRHIDLSLLTFPAACSGIPSASPQLSPTRPPGLILTPGSPGYLAR
jgi:hypothetical protein